MASKMTKGYVGWKISPQERDRILNHFPALFERVIAHHVTLKFGVTQDHVLPTATMGYIVGESVDPSGVQALIVSINNSVARPGGGVLHVTWSLEPGRKPVESNQVIANQGWHPVTPFPIELTPEFFPF
jgi:hypothetical protein